MLELGSIAFNTPWLIPYQIRLLQKYLRDDYRLSIYDNSDPEFRERIEESCFGFRTRYVSLSANEGLPSQRHMQGLAEACVDLLSHDAPLIGFLDHDIFPTVGTSLVELAEPGFFGLPQTHVPSQSQYLWPGLCVFTKEWLDGRVPNFGAIHNVDQRKHGDTGSRLSELFRADDWERLRTVPHLQVQIRIPDEHGPQSWAIEQIGDWMHCTNASGWRQVPDPDGRNALLRELVKGLWMSAP